MTPNDSISAAARLHTHFDRRSPLWFTFGANSDDMRFVGLRKGKLARFTVQIETAPFSAEASALRVNLVHELRRQEHRLSGQSEAVSYAIIRAFVAAVAEDAHAAEAQ